MAILSCNILTFINENIIRVTHNPSTSQAAQLFRKLQHSLLIMVNGKKKINFSVLTYGLTKILSLLPAPISKRSGLMAYGVVCAMMLFLSPRYGLAQKSPENEPDLNQLVQGKVFIYKLDSDAAAGKGYKLVYMVDASLDVYWKFKTDFENDFLRTNKLITEHRLVEHIDNVAITETVFATKPGVKFRWRTVSSPGIYRLDFELLNPKECGQKFHYGHILIEAVGEQSKVTQIAYFDFFGATLWMNYPWYGGMHHYLSYTARWEQETVLRLMDRYR